MTGTLRQSVPSASSHSVCLPRTRQRTCCCVMCLDTVHHVHVLHLSLFVLHWSFQNSLPCSFSISYPGWHFLSFRHLCVFPFSPAPKDVIKPDHPKPISGSPRPFRSWEHSCQPALRRSHPPASRPSFSLSSLVHLSHPASSPPLLLSSHHSSASQNPHSPYLCLFLSIG